MMKTCVKCRRVVQPLTEFYSHPTMADGHLGKCRDCARRDVRMHRRSSDRVRANDRARAKLPHRVAKAKRNKILWSARNPDGAKAHYAVAYAIRMGRLKRLPCEVCGDSKSHGHHRDYSKPLDVIFLCARCHFRMAHSMAPTKRRAEVRE